jgi:4-carboxymuconolactone decarboxylase
MTSPRFTPPDPSSLDGAQRAVWEATERGRRGSVPANVQAWLASPEFARRAASLGEFVRYQTSLGPRWSELAILVVARHWSAAYEWAIHAGEAARAGVETEVIDAVAHGRRPAVDDGDAAVIAFAHELVGQGRVTDRTFARAASVLGPAGVVDLVGVVGYYTLVAFTLNAFEVPVPSSGPALPPLAPPG